MIQNAFQEIDSERLISLRRELHRHPELKFDLPVTTSIVKQELAEIGIPFTEQYCIGSVIADINSGKKPLIALRADMDALPLQEKTNLPYKSENDGIMHACGHDAHTAMLLGTARALKRIESDLSCAVRLIFQPCEEGPEQGSDALIETGVMEGVDAIFALHVDNMLPVGSIGLCAGNYMAACHSYEIEFFGKTAHATKPHTGSDALAMAVKAYQDIYLMDARIAPPLEKHTISIGSLQSGTTHNVVPDYSRMLLCVRYFDQEFDAVLEEKIKQICHNSAAEMGGSCKVNDPFKGAAVINDPKLTSILKKSAEAVVHPENVYEIEPVLSSEDFSNYLKTVPGVMFRLGTGNPAKCCTADLHNNDFCIDEDALSIGSKVFVQLIIDLCKENDPL